MTVINPAVENPVNNVGPTSNGPTSKTLGRRCTKWYKNVLCLLGSAIGGTETL